MLGVKSAKRNRQYYRTPPLERFMTKVEKRGPDECWEWQGYRQPSGHGQFARIDGTVREPAHRSAYTLLVGEIPAGMCVCHTCDNPPCVNPSHLFLGTQADNVADMASKWRTRSKLTPAQVEEIRNSTEKSRDLAARFGLKSHKSILNIRHGRTFAGLG